MVVHSVKKHSCCPIAGWEDMMGTSIPCCAAGLRVKSISVTGPPGVEGRPRAWWAAGGGAGTWPHTVSSSSSTHFYQLPCPSVLPLWVSCPSLPQHQCVCFCLTQGEGLCVSVHVKSVCLSLCTSACEYLVLVCVCPWMRLCVCLTVCCLYLCVCICFSVLICLCVYPTVCVS